MGKLSKIVCILVFLCSLLLIFAMGRSNVRNFEKVQHSIETIYKDRLVVKGIIFEISSLLHQKEIAVAAKDISFFNRKNTSINLKISEQISEFKETYLVAYEKDTLDRFERGISQLKVLEEEIKDKNSLSADGIVVQKLKNQLDSLKMDLRTLLGIQLSEGKRKLMSSFKAVESMNLNQSIENYSILIIGVLILVVLLVPGPRNNDGKISLS